MGDRFFSRCPKCPEQKMPVDWPEDQPWYPETDLYFAEFTDWKSKCGVCGVTYIMGHTIYAEEEVG